MKSRIIRPGAEVMFNPMVDVTQEFVDKEVWRIKAKKRRCAPLTDFEKEVLSAVEYEKRTGLKFTPYHYCYLRDL